MKPSLLLLATTSAALLLAGCGGKSFNPANTSNPGKPGAGPDWTNPLVCQTELPQPTEITDFSDEKAFGGPDDVVVVERPGDGETDGTAYIVSPKKGTVEQAFKVHPDPNGRIRNPFDDRITGGLLLPPKGPPPPPIGEDHLRYLVQLASRITKTSADKCPGPQLPHDDGMNLINR